MALDSIINGASGNKAVVDANGNLAINLPTTISQAGAAQTSYTLTSGQGRLGRVTEEGEQYVGQSQLLFFSGFNNPPATTPMSAHWGCQATTLAMASQAGFLRLNSGAVTTANSGIAIQSWRQFSMEDGAGLRIKFKLRHNNGAVANKQAEIGFGSYAIAANQAGSTNEFIGFRWNTSGALQGVLEYSTGSTPTSLTVNINGGVPLSDNVSREYEVVITDNIVEFWINNVYQAQIVYGVDSPGLIKASGYPVMIRLFNSGSSPSLAPVFDIGDVAVLRIGPGVDIPHPIRQVLAGRHAIYNQPGLTATDGQTASVPASGTAPTAGTPSNTTANVTGLGGFIRFNGSAIVATAHTNLIMTDYTNPAYPIVAGAGNDVRNLIITDILISPMIVTTVLAGGGFTGQWFVAIGHSAASLATTTANGTTALATKATGF
jgi:hypothetical protein